jgi:hypothetical protein
MRFLLFSFGALPIMKHTEIKEKSLLAKSIG